MNPLRTKQEETGWNSGGRYVGQSFYFQVICTHTCTVEEIKQTHTHTRSLTHSCWFNHTLGTGWLRCTTVWELHNHQNKSKLTDPSSHQARQLSQRVRSGAADSGAEYWSAQFKLLGWISILLSFPLYIVFSNSKEKTTVFVKKCVNDLYVISLIPQFSIHPFSRRVAGAAV